MKIKFLHLITTFMMSMCLLCAYVYGAKEVRSDREFQKKLERAPFSVVLFYDYHTNSPVWQRNIERQKRQFDAVSRSGLYRNGNVQFLQLDAARKKLASTACMYAGKTLPSFMLFRFGKAVKSFDGNNARLIGFTKSNQIRDFINKHLRKNIEGYIDRQSDRSMANRERDDASAYMLYGYPYMYPTYAYDLPWYYNYPNYYPPPSVNFGVNIGW